MYSKISNILMLKKKFSIYVDIINLEQFYKFNACIFRFFRKDNVVINSQRYIYIYSYLRNTYSKMSQESCKETGNAWED